MLEVFGSVTNIIAMITITNVTQTISSKLIFYSPRILRRPNPTLKPVSVSAHIMPATLNISLLINKTLNYYFSKNRKIKIHFDPKQPVLKKS